MPLRVKATHPALEPESRIFLDPRTLTPWKYDGIMRERFWTPAVKQAQVKYRRPYNCRHTYASTMLTAGKNPTWLAKQMKHKDWGMIRLVYPRWIETQILLTLFSQYFSVDLSAQPDIFVKKPE